MRHPITHKEPAIRLNGDVTIFSILCANDGVGYFAERGLEQSCSRDATIRAIAEGQVEHVLKVFAFNSIEGWSRDVTEDIAIEIACRCSPGEPILPGVRDFIESAAGTEYARGLMVVDRSFAA